MAERRVWEVAQVDAALDAALETGPLDFEDGDIAQNVDIDGEVVREVWPLLWRLVAMAA